MPPLHLDPILTLFYPDIAYESETELLDDATSPSAGKQIPYEGAGEATGDVHWLQLEYSQMYEDP